MSAGGDVYREAFARGLAPDPVLTVSAWADEHRWLTARGAAEPGRYRSDRTPFWREPMDNLSVYSDVQHQCIIKASQVGASEFGNNWIGYIIDQCPGPTMLVQPTIDLAKRFSRQRVEPLIRESPRLADRVRPSRERDSGNTVLLKEFANGMLVLAGANSPASFRQMPVRFLMRDEIDAWPEALTEEGDPMRLSERGTKTFERSHKILDISTPTVEGRSNIHRVWLRSDQRYYHVPCPLCGEKQKLEFNKADDDGRYGLVWEGSDPQDEDEIADIAATAIYVCRFCRGEIPEHKKPWMLARGEWIPEKPGRRIRGYNLNGLYSPPGLGWSWPRIVEEWYTAQRNPNELRVFVNQVLAEPWRERGDAPPWQVLYNRRESYQPGIAPKGVLVLTAGADVQQDRIEVEVLGWGRNRETWSVAYYVFPGLVIEREPWQQLEELLATGLPHASGVQLPIRRLCIDTGGSYTQGVYYWVRKQRRDQVLGIQGRDTLPVLVGPPRAVDINFQGVKLRRGMQLWPLGVSVGKQEIYQLLRIDQPTHPERDGYPSGYCHFPEYDESWFKGLTAEQIVAKVVRGYRKHVWELIPGRRNEPLDCRNYARAAGAVLGLDRWREEQWDRAERSLGKPLEPPKRQRRRPAQQQEGMFSRWRSQSRSTTRSKRQSPREL